MNTEKNNRNILLKLQDFLGSRKGKIILNYAYSWGAAVVILGTLFKLTHISGANLMLWIGMGTEVLVFFISAFDVPASGNSGNAGVSNINIQVAETSSPSSGTPQVVGAPANVASSSVNPSGSITITAPQGSAPMYGAMPQAGGYVPDISPEMKEATAAYLEQLKLMTQTLNRFTDQASSLSQDAEQMTNLSRNLSGINAIYEVQLRSISSQLGTIEEVHQQTRKMAQQIEELNIVYTRMLEAMNANGRK